jgi:hypothetical protein
LKIAVKKTKQRFRLSKSAVFAYKNSENLKKSQKKSQKNGPPVLEAGEPADEHPARIAARAEVADDSAHAVAWGVAVAGWQWDHSIEEITAVRMVPVRVWQWQYWQSCGDLKQAKMEWIKKSGDDGSGAKIMQWHGEWQWQGGSGTNPFARTARFEWYQKECGSGSIGSEIVKKSKSKNS